MGEKEYVFRRDWDGIAILTMNRPESRNALSLGMISALQCQFELIAQDKSIKVVILSGSGTAFCAGHDLKEMKCQNFDLSYSEKLFANCTVLMQKMLRLPQPVIAQVHGYATAAGVQLVASADLAVATTNSQFATPGVNIGLFCSTPMVAVSRNISNKHAMQMLLLGDLIDANTAYRFGLINEVVEPDELEDYTLSMAKKIAEKSYPIISLGKEAFYRQSELSIDDAYSYASDVMKKNLEMHDAREGISAFIEKRPPIWKSSSN
ncbi:enoyl-CoA hydratase [Polynucleobacter sp. MWH-HuK1]|uniref:enoyl-CoA hydratase n=1 Tax=Polynucleobacter sp. MWH-HuK1 TaxID=1743158 RepID=UPI001C0CDA1D|nr:enoyl-CoA hydratase [Polynucleobacter sp. MWH-HuK1]MBU3565214.1 enoyl-CoA hydratase [Polynucleobacter sp. MWH-HuK1]